jgi:hypothetical protein
MLSTEYGITNYKETNVRMNIIKVDQREWRIGPTISDRDKEWKEILGESSDEEEVFDKNQSVFKSYKLETPKMLELMFEGDFNLTKLPKKIEKDELPKIKEAFAELYPKIKNLFATLTVDSTYPTYSGNDYVVFL